MVFIIYGETALEKSICVRIYGVNMNYIIEKIEEKIGLDLNHDGRIGGPGPMARLEQATHIDLNRDGIIGGYRPPADGGIVGKIESSTHIDINRDGRIGGSMPYYPPQPKH